MERIRFVEPGGSEDAEREGFGRLSGGGEGGECFGLRVTCVFGVCGIVDAFTTDKQPTRKLAFVSVLDFHSPVTAHWCSEARRRREAP